MPCVLALLAVSTRGSAVRARAGPTTVTSLAVAVEPTVGALIERARSADELLAAAARIPAPGPPFAMPFLADDVHQMKRQRLACNALQRLAASLVGSGHAAERQAVLLDERFGHLASCAAAPSSCRADGADQQLDAASARHIVGSLAALSALCAEDAAERVRSGTSGAPALARLRAAALELGGRAEALCGLFALHEAASARLSIRRLLGSELPTARLERAVGALPFDFLFPAPALPAAGAAGGAANGGSAASAGSALHRMLLAGELSVGGLLAHIPFAQAELLTADGRTVAERRRTAWLAERGIGALAYSGKLMQPQPMPQPVLAIRDALAADGGELFDCVLCNLYAEGGEAACKWHCDPEHGSRWALPTSVLAIGETRRFGFRPLRDSARSGEASWQLVLPLFCGDVVLMSGECNRQFEHAVFPAEGAANRGARISLVFKRALLCNGRKGHGLAGEGRRARARQRQAAEGGRTGEQRQSEPPATGARQPRPGARGAPSRPAPVFRAAQASAHTSGGPSTAGERLRNGRRSDGATSASAGRAHQQTVAAAAGRRGNNDQALSQSPRRQRQRSPK